MWHSNKTVHAVHTKNGSQIAFAVISGVGLNGWIRIQPNSPDGVTNVFTILAMALANNRKVDVYIQNGQIGQATLR